MNILLALPVILPLLAAGLSILLGRSRATQRVVGVATLSATSAASLAILLRVDADGPVASQVGGWRAPIGITIVADRLTGLMLVVSSVVLLAVLVYAVGQRTSEQDHVAFHPAYLVLAAGVSASFLAGDLFNLFVAFEMMLTSSYVLITLGGRRDQIRTGMTYVVVSLVASILFLFAIAFVYASTGTVNMADLADKLPALPDGVRQALGLLLLVVFGIKAAAFPLYFWLPDSYPTAPAPVTAVFAGLLTKVGVYAIIRTQTLFVAPGDRSSGLILGMAAATMLVGVLGALAQDDMKRILSFHIVSQIGYMLMGLGLFTRAGLAWAVFYVVHHIVVKTTLFLTGGLVERAVGSGRLSHIGGVRHSAPLLAWLFMLPALSLAGIPPFSGFVAKLGLVQAGMASGDHWVVAVSLVVSALTLMSMAKIWAGAFWGADQMEEGFEPPGDVVRGARPMVGATAVLALASIAIALGAGWLWGVTDRAAEGLLDPSAYVAAVESP